MFKNPLDQVKKKDFEIDIDLNLEFTKKFGILIFEKIKFSYRPLSYQGVRDGIHRQMMLAFKTQFSEY